MPEANVEIVRRAYDGWSRDDFSSAEEVFHPDIDWRTSGKWPGFKPAYRGLKGVREFWDTMKEAWEHSTIHVDRMLQANDVLLCVGRFEAVGRASGVKVELPFWHVWEIDGGQVVKYTAHQSSDAAFKAAGLQE
jgi:ketosteroid isomerase-like protein